MYELQSYDFLSIKNKQRVDSFLHEPQYQRNKSPT